MTIVERPGATRESKSPPIAVKFVPTVVTSAVSGALKFVLSTADSYGLPAVPEFAPET